MNFKLDTKDKFHVITLLESNFTADMAAKLSNSLLPYLQNDVKNIVLNLKELSQIDQDASNSLVSLQQNFHEAKASFVICEIQQTVKDYLKSLQVLEKLNYTLTETEAWDIVQMEEMEREFMNDEVNNL